MITLNGYLTEATAEKDRHLTHIEDAVLEGGVKGTRNAIKFLEALRDMFADDGKTISESKDSLILRTKFDGAPAIYAGVNPENDKFFIGTKSVLSKNPKINYSESDIDKHFSGKLAERLKITFRYLSELGIKDIIHGDLMYIRSDLKRKTIDGKKYITFRPNTITYAVPENTTLAKQILDSQIGIVFHTTYHGDKMSNLQTHFDVDIGKLKSSKNVWYRENKFVDVTGKATLTQQENETLVRLLTKAESIFIQIPSSVLNEISVNVMYRMPIMTFHNKKIRDGDHIDTEQVNKLIQWISDRYENASENKSSERDKLIRWFKNNRHALKLIYELQDTLIKAKQILINKFDQCNELGTFIHTDDGYRVTTPEGYVCAWSTGGNAVKLIDRLNFSRSNFLTAKDWDS